MVNGGLSYIFDKSSFEHKAHMTTAHILTTIFSIIYRSITIICGTMIFLSLFNLYVNVIMLRHQVLLKYYFWCSRGGGKEMNQFRLTSAKERTRILEIHLLWLLFFTYQKVVNLILKKDSYVATIFSSFYSLYITIERTKNIGDISSLVVVPYSPTVI